MPSPSGPGSRNSNLKLVRSQPALRILLRRSEKEGQEFSIDTQREGALRFAEGLRRRESPVLWEGVHDYVDDGIAGDDFAGRVALRKLLAEVGPGDVVVCRDHFRLGRDAIDSAVTVRELVRDRRARLFYYSSGQEVAFQTAIDAAMTFIQGVGAQMELEAIRSRTREALRQRVRAGRIAGGTLLRVQERAQVGPERPPVHRGRGRRGRGGGRPMDLSHVPRGLGSEAND